MNGYCFKDRVTIIVCKYNHGKYFCIIFSFMFDRIAELEGRKTKLANAIFFFFFFTKLLLFFIVSF